MQSRNISKLYIKKVLLKILTPGELWFPMSFEKIEIIWTGTSKWKKKMFFQLLAKYLWPKWIYPLIIRLLEVRHALNFWNLFVFTYLKKENQCYQRTHQFRSYIICRMLSNIIVLVFSILFQDWTWIFLCFLLTCDPNLLWKWMSLCTLDAWT